MPNDLFKDFIWFDRPAGYDQSTGTVTPSRQGFLSSFGSGLYQIGSALEGTEQGSARARSEAERQRALAEKRFEQFQKLSEQQKELVTQERLAKTIVDPMGKKLIEADPSLTKDIALKEYGKDQLKSEKTKLEIEQLKAQNKFLEMIGKKDGGFEGSDLPPGTSMKVAGMNIPVNRKFTEGEIKSLSTADALNTEIASLKGLLNADIDKPLYEQAQFTGSLPFGAFQEKGQEFKLLKNSIGERLLRLRSGAQINEKEYQRFRKLLPSIFRSDKLDIDQLNRFEKEFDSIKGRILSGATYDRDKKNFVVEVKDQSSNLKDMSTEDLFKRLVQ